MTAHDAVKPSATFAGAFSDRRALCVIPLLALFLVHPLIAHGCSCGHDFDFHLTSWFEAAMQIAHGGLHPHWAYTPAWDAGEPRFVFYPPMSWYLGALLGLFLVHLPRISEATAWTAVPIVFTWIALTLSGLTMYRLARRFAAPSSALIAATFYLANPYMLFTAFERTAYGELLAAAWIPLLFDAVLRERISATRIAVPVALLWSTNAPAAVMGCYALAFLVAVRTIVEIRHAQPLRNFVHSITGTALGLGLAAFYIVPAAYERRYVQTAMAIIAGTRVEVNFLFEHTGNSLDDRMHDAVLRTASWIAVALLSAGAASLIAAWLRIRRLHAIAPQFPLATLALFTGAVALMLTPLSVFIWNHVPQLAYLQFPWRTLALLAPISALAIACALPRFASPSSRPRDITFSVIAAFIIAAALGLPAWHLFRQYCDPEYTAATRIALFHSNAGTDPTDEYTPVTADNDALQSTNPSWWLADSAEATSASTTTEPSIRTAPTHFTITTSHAEFLILNLRDYPAWRITLAHNGASPQLITERAPRADGLITIHVPEGHSTLDIRYAQMPDQTIGDAISLCSLVLLAALAVSRRHRRTRAPAALA